MPDAQAAYDALLDRARADSNVEGVVLVGSRTMPGFVTSHSDFDVFVVLRAHHPGWQRSMRGGPADIVPVTIEEFEQHALPGSTTAWNRPAFVHARVDFDRHGRVRPIADRKRSLTPEEADALVRRDLDGYINSLYRSLKNGRDGRPLAARLDAADSIPILLTVLFALQERVRPWAKYLAAEVQAQPLPVERILERIETILSTADCGLQQALFRDVEAVARGRGYGSLIDDWEPDVALLRGEVGVESAV
jgi:hypothetical protein